MMIMMVATIMSKGQVPPHDSSAASFLKGTLRFHCRCNKPDGLPEESCTAGQRVSRAGSGFRAANFGPYRLFFISVKMADNNNNNEYLERLTRTGPKR